MSILNLDTPELDMVPLKEGTLAGIFTFKGVKVELVKTEPPKWEYSSGKRDRGLRNIIIDGEHRGVIVFPHGFGKEPAIRSLKGNGDYTTTNLDTVLGDCQKNVFFLQLAVERILQLHTDGKLKTVEEIKAAEDKIEQDRKDRETIFAASQQRRKEEREAHVAGLQSILDERMNLTAEQHAALEWAIKQFK